MRLRRTQILAPQHIQFRKYNFDFEPKELYGNKRRSNDTPKINRKRVENKS